MNWKIPIDGRWKTITSEHFKRWADMGSDGKALAEMAQEAIRRYQSNPLSFFLPHGREWSDEVRTYANGKLVVPPSSYPKKYGNDVVAFLNDWESDLSIIIAPNQVGKSSALVAWTGFRVLPCKPD